MVNVPTSLNNLKTNVDDLDVGKLRTVPEDLKKLTDLVSNEVVKNTKFSTLIHTNQYNTGKQSCGRKFEILVKITWC